MKKTYDLIQLNKINGNGRKYIKESFNVLPDNVPVYFGRTILYGNSGDSNFKYLVGKASNFKIDSQVVTCEINLLDSKIKELIKAGQIYCIPTGFGEVRLEDSIVNDYTLECIDLCYDSAFKGIRNKMIFKDPAILEIE